MKQNNSTNDIGRNLSVKAPLLTVLTGIAIFFVSYAWYVLFSPQPEPGKWTLSNIFVLLIAWVIGAAIVLPALAIIVKRLIQRKRARS